MEENVAFLELILFILCGISGIAILIFVLRKNDQGIDYDKYIILMNEQIKENLEILDKGNKKIDKTEKRILECKRKLGMKSFYKKNYKNIVF